MKLSTIFLCISCLAAAAPLDAQINLPIRDGARVRVIAPRLPAPLFGRASTDSASNTLIVTTRNDAARVTVPRAATTRIDVGDGRNRLGGAALGGGIGLVAGAVVGGLTLAEIESDGLATLVGMFAGAVGGLAVGALTGFGFAPERWHTVYTAANANESVSVSVSDGARVYRYADGTIAVVGEKDRRRGVVRGALVFAGLTLIVGGIDLASDKIGAGEFIETVAGNAAVGGVVGYFVAPRGRQLLPAPTP